MTPKEYREEHKRCRTCEYWQPFSSHKYGNCLVKEQKSRANNGRFCQVYKAKEFEK